MADASISEDQPSPDNKEREFAMLTISLYKNQPALWKVGSPEYSNKFMRQRALREITSRLKELKPHYNEQLLRRKINILRTNFNKEFRKREQLRLSGYEEGEPTLWYYDSLLFLKDEAGGKPSTAPGERTMKPSPPKKRKRKFTVDVNVEPANYDPDSSDEGSKYIKSESFNESHFDEPMIVFNKDPLVAPQRSRSDTFRSLSEYEAVGVNVAKKLEKMDAAQAIYAESVINAVLRKGLEKKLSDLTDLCENGCGRTRYAMGNRIN